MKYIEELNCGDCFTHNASHCVLTIDFKKNGDRLAINLNNGNPVWLKSNDMVSQIDIFTLDKDNNIVAIKERQKDAISQNSNIS